jgi:hypothetical protein
MPEQSLDITDSPALRERIDVIAAGIVISFAPDPEDLLDLRSVRKHLLIRVAKLVPQGLDHPAALREVLFGRGAMQAAGILLQVAAHVPQDRRLRVGIGFSPDFAPVGIVGICGAARAEAEYGQRGKHDDETPNLGHAEAPKI